MLFYRADAFTNVSTTLMAERKDAQVTAEPSPPKHSAASRDRHKLHHRSAATRRAHLFPNNITIHYYYY
jgi:hypothetical protein